TGLNARPSVFGEADWSVQLSYALNRRFQVLQVIFVLYPIFCLCLAAVGLLVAELCEGVVSLAPHLQGGAVPALRAHCSFSFPSSWSMSDGVVYSVPSYSSRWGSVSVPMAYSSSRNVTASPGVLG